MNKNVLIGFFLWVAYNEVVTFIAALWLGWNWLYLQPFVIVGSLLMVALTFGSQTKSDN